MTNDRPPMRGAVAGSTLLAAALLCAAIGFGIGLLVGAPAPFATAGVFVGFALGFRLVYSRYKDL
jgi:4-hydroxybenzoate polyprenyltransferase